METTESNQAVTITAEDLKNALILKGNILQLRINEPHNPPAELEFKNEKEFKEIVINSTKLLFGENTVFLNTEKTGDNFPDGLLFDFKDAERPRLYLFDISISKQDFFAEIFPRVMRYLLLCKESNHSLLIETVLKNIGWRNKLKKAIGDRDTREFLQAALNSPHVLLIRGNENFEFPDDRLIYPLAWVMMVKQVLIRKFQSNGDTVCIMEPGFEEIQNGKVKRKREPREEGVEYNEDFHLQKTSEAVKGVYAQIRAELLKADNSLVFHAKKYYVSVGKPKLFLFRFSKSKITIVVMVSDKDARKQIKHHEVRTLAESVQKFWNGPSCEVVIENEEKLNEVVVLLKKLVKGQE